MNASFFWTWYRCNFSKPWKIYHCSLQEFLHAISKLSTEGFIIITIIIIIIFIKICLNYSFFVSTTERVCWRFDIFVLNIASTHEAVLTCLQFFYLLNVFVSLFFQTLRLLRCVVCFKYFVYCFRFALYFSLCLPNTSRFSSKRAQLFRLCFALWLV